MIVTLFYTIVINDTHTVKFDACVIWGMCVCVCVRVHVCVFHRFLFKNKIFSTVEGFRRLLFWLTISPAFENILSRGTEDAGTQR